MASVGKLSQIHDVCSRAHPTQLDAFLNSLGGPAILTFPGENRARCRLVVTLLHGNEPSGLRAVHTLACQHFVPAVTSHVIVASTAAAATLPLFTHRMLPGEPDLNRCFGVQGQGRQYELARAIMAAIDALQPECVVDLHNTSGSGPDFAVSVCDSHYHQALAACFTSRMVITDLRLGALMEQPLGCPVVTVEAGGARDTAADLTALTGLKALFGTAQIATPCRPVTLLHHPRRLELKPGYSIAYLPQPDPGTEVCLRADIERFNTGVTPAGTYLGWFRRDCLAAVTMDNDAHTLADYFTLREHKLYTCVDLQLFMITTNANIAATDCLFYFVKA